MTGGDSGAALEGLKDIYYNPEVYDVLPFYHNYTLDGAYTYTGFFIPSFAQVYGFIDKRGYCDVLKAKEHLQKERDKMLSSPKALIKHCAEYCFNAEEAFALEGENKFNKVNLANLLAEIRLHKRGPRPVAGYIDYFYKNNKHTLENIDGYKWIPNPEGKVKILEHPVWSDLYKENIEKQRKEAEEKGEEFEIPIYKEMNNLYVAGIDGIDIGANQTSNLTKDPSDFCITILRRSFGMNDPQIVAMYKDRPGDIREAFKIAMCLIKYYNAKVNIEATRMSMVSWARDNKCLLYFMKRPRATLTDIKHGTTKQYGTPATKTIIEQHTDLTAAFVEDYCHTIWFEEILELLTSYNDENKGKFDIVASLGMLFLADLELSGRLPTNVTQEVEEFQDFGYYVDENGYKKFGIIPKRKQIKLEFNLEEYYDPYRIESSDPRVYEYNLPSRIYRSY